MSCVPLRPFTASAAFLSYLDTLDPTDAYEKRQRMLAKAEKAQRLADYEDSLARRAALRETKAIADAEERAKRPPSQRGWGKGGKRDKHVVLGRVHMMEDDARESQRTRGQAFAHRYTVASKD